MRVSVPSPSQRGGVVRHVGVGWGRGVWVVCWRRACVLLFGWGDLALPREDPFFFLDLGRVGLGDRLWGLGGVTNTCPFVLADPFVDGWLSRCWMTERRYSTRVRMPSSIFFIPHLPSVMQVVLPTFHSSSMDGCQLSFSSLPPLVSARGYLSFSLSCMGTPPPRSPH